jgi:mannose-1-phosphate guanylyltransferase
VILCGGGGTRFWPASRAARPKPFVPLIRGLTLFDETLSRIARLAPPERTRVVSAAPLARITRRALRPHPGVVLMLEPEARNTAAAIAWAAASVAAQDPDGVVGIFPADHHIPSAPAFARCVRGAAQVARGGDALVLIGIDPDRAETAYGYLQLGELSRPPAHRVKRFLEKPDSARARRFFNSGGYLWNAGMVLATAGRILEETRRHAPEVWQPLGSALEKIAAGGRVSAAALARAYRRTEKISFDYAVLERSRCVLAVPGGFRWSDLGSWNSLGEHLPELDGNRVGGTKPVATLDSRDNIIWNTTDRAVALLGVEDLIVVETEDALLVCSKDRAQEVRQIVDQLSGRRRGDLT